jgi:GT2 family glycosyltransferase
VIVSWNTRELTLRCLAALARDVEAGGVTAETILVDNASEDRTAQAVARTRPDVTIVEAGGNLGFAGGANLGIAHARGRHVVLLNPDAAVAVGTLGALARFLDENPRAGAAGCRLVSEDGRAQFSCGRFLTPFNQFAETLGLDRWIAARALRRSYAYAELDAPAVAVDWVAGACVAIRRAALEQVGPLDERFFMYAEDEDICYRLRAADWEVYVLGRTHVTHVGGASAVQALEPMRAAARASQAAFMRKHHGAARAALFRTLMRIAALKPRREDDRVGWGR